MIKLFKSSTVVLLLLLGCTQPASRLKVEGSVKYKDRPVADQTLVLVWDGDKDRFFTQSIRINPDGSFAAEVTTPGNFKVMIAPSLAAQEGNDPAKTIDLPEKYRSRDTTDLTWQLEAGINKKDFILQD